MLSACRRAAGRASAAQIASRPERTGGFYCENKPKKHLPRLAVAAIIIAAALTLTAAAAAVIHQFRNDILVSDLSEIPEPTGDAPTAVAVAEPASDRKAPKTLAERLADGPEITLEEWRNGEKIGGTTSHLYGGWDHAELISDDPALCIRRITRDEDGAEKMQYMAADPAALLPVLTGKIRFDLTWLSENYKAVSLDDQAFIIRDEDGNLVSEYFWAAYGANDGKGWFRLEIMHDTTWNLSPDYIVDGTFEEAYYYTTANGYEFLITADGDTVWARLHDRKDERQPVRRVSDHQRSGTDRRAPGAFHLGMKQGSAGGNQNDFLRRFFCSNCIAFFMEIL